MIWTVVAVAVLVTGAVADAVATRVLLRRAEQRIAERLGSPASVHVGHGLAALRLVLDAPLTAVITAKDVPAAGGTIPYLRVVLDGVRRLPRTADEVFATHGGRFRAEFDGETIIALAGLPGVVRGISIEAGRVRFRLPGGASIPASVSVEEGAIVLAPQGDRLGPLKVVRFAVPVERLPYGAEMTGVSCDAGSLSVHGTLAPYPP